MKILVYEYFACGLFIPGDDFDRAMVEGAAVEGFGMLRAALSDFASLDGAQAFTVVRGETARRLFDIPGVTVIDYGEAPCFEALTGAIDECDAALMIAPETNGTLVQANRLVEEKGKISLGSRGHAVTCSGDKLLFAETMKQAGIPHPETRAVSPGRDNFAGEWVSKPFDGAGSFMVRRHSGACADIASRRMIAQEFVHGAPMSVCVVSNEKESVILSVNRQRLGGDMEYTGGEILDIAPDKEIAELVGKIKSAIPGLNGYWGADFIQTDNGPVVIEVNPRLTTSYCALSAALDINPAQVIVDMVMGRPAPVIGARRPVSFNTKGEVMRL